jgi:hypothetical protein
MRLLKRVNKESGMTIGPIYKFDMVYFVETSSRNTANPVAIRPEIYDSRVQWMDTSKGKIIKLGTINDLDHMSNSAPEVIEITSEKGEHYRLVKLTLDIYNNKVRDRIANPPTFDSDEAVQKFYLTSDFEIY